MATFITDDWVFVSCDGPRLGDAQKHVVRARAMVDYRQRKRTSATPQRPQKTMAKTTRKLPVRKNDNASGQAKINVDFSGPPTSRPTGQRNEAFSEEKCQEPIQRLRELPQPSHYMHGPGVEAIVYEEYVWLAHSCKFSVVEYSKKGASTADSSPSPNEVSDFINWGFAVLGTKKHSLFLCSWPTTRTCLFTGLVFARSVVDSFRGTNLSLTYPAQEMEAIQGLQKMLVNPDMMSLATAASAFLLLFEIVRSTGSNVQIHKQGLRRLVTLRGGLENVMPIGLSKTILMIDALDVACFDGSPLFTNMGAPRLWLSSGDVGDEEEATEATRYLLSSPLLRRRGDDFTLLNEFITDKTIARDFIQSLEETFTVVEVTVVLLFNSFFADILQLLCRYGYAPADDLKAISAFLHSDSRLNQLADSSSSLSNIPGLILQTYALAARIFFNSVCNRHRLDHESNNSDMRALCDLMRFIGVKRWRGMPYVYLWVILIGHAASTTKERHFFVAELMRCAFSYGSYQTDVFARFFENFLHVRRAVSSPLVPSID